MLPNKIVGLLCLGLALGLGGCSSSPKKQAKLDPFAGKGSPYYKGSGKIPVGGGRYHVGKPYQVAGRWYKPYEDKSYDRSGRASWYGEAFHRRKTSNGEYFDMNIMSAAHPTLPLPSYAKVTNLANGRTAIVRINDRGPFVGTRLIDLSKRVAEELEFKQQGHADVRVQYVGLAPLDDHNGTHLTAMNHELESGASVETLVASAHRAAPGIVQVADARPSRQQNHIPSTGKNYYVQVASFADPANAEIARDDLQALGPVNVEPTNGSSGPLYRVRVGPIANNSAAEETLSNVMARGHPDARLVMADAG